MFDSLSDHSRGFKIATTCLGFAVFAFLYLPMLLLVVYSFSEGASLAEPIQGLSFKWFVTLYDNEDVLRATWNSIRVASSTALVTLLIGVPAAYGIHRFAFPGAWMFERVAMLPLMVPGLVTGLSILLVLKQWNLSNSLGAVVIGHGIAFLPIVISLTIAALKQSDRGIEEASLDLGAGYLRTFLRVTLPSLKHAIVGSGMLVFLLSFDEVAITFLLTGTETTLPMYIWATLRRGVSPELCALATIVIAFSGATAALSLRFIRTK